MGSAPASSERIVDQLAGATHKGTKMTNQEELQYLLGIVLEASKWRISEGDETDTIRLEVQDRIRRLSGQNTTDENGYNQSEPVPEQQEPEEAPVRTKSLKSKEWMKGRVHVKFEDGNYHWCKAEHCEKVPRPTQPYLFKWAIKDEFKDLYKSTTHRLKAVSL